MDLSEKVALVTGGASGIGEAAALELARRGAAVAVLDRDEGLACTVAARITGDGGRAIGVGCDVAESAAVQAAVDRTLAELGGLHIAVNSAGITGPAALTADVTDEEWQTVLGINLTGVWHCMRSELRAMLAGEGGAIVNIASTAGLRGGKRTAAYTASKHGVVGLTRASAMDYATRGIRINVVCPGPIDTPMLERLTGGNERLAQQLARTTPMGRPGRPDEVARVIAWLCSDDASYITGETISVDGGGAARG